MRSSRQSLLRSSRRHGVSSCARRSRWRSSITQRTDPPTPMRCLRQRLGAFRRPRNFPRSRKHKRSSPRLRDELTIRRSRVTSGIGPTQTFATSALVSAIWGKAYPLCSTRGFPSLTRSRHGRHARDRDKDSFNCRLCGNKIKSQNGPASMISMRAALL
jgi:hypothetical protein